MLLPLTRWILARKPLLGGVAAFCFVFVTSAPSNSNLQWELSVFDLWPRHALKYLESS